MFYLTVKKLVFLVEGNTLASYFYFNSSFE